MQAEKNLIQDEMSEKIIQAAQQIAFHCGADQVTVRKVLQRLDISNRVFYNRFQNIEEVLKIVYERTVLEIRKSIIGKFDPDGDFFSQVEDIVANTLITSYEYKMKFNQYVFESDSVQGDNFIWWKAEISKLIDFGISKGYLRSIDTESMSYAIWCFIRGYNSDAVGRKLPLETAVKNFKYSFGMLLNGMKA